MLLEQCRPQLEQFLGTVLEHPQNRLPVGHVERDDPGFAVVGTLGVFSGIGELAADLSSRSLGR